MTIEADVQALSRRGTNPPAVMLYVFDHDTLDVRAVLPLGPSALQPPASAP